MYICNLGEGKKKTKKQILLDPEPNEFVSTPSAESSSLAMNTKQTVRHIMME